MKSYTDIEQSTKLANILPIESADMYYFGIDDYPNSSKQYHEILIGKIDKDDIDEFGHIPCWSLAALLSVLPKSARLERGKATELYRASLPVELEASDWYINPVDACYEMIIKLHEQKLL